MKRKRVVVLGATGSIGESALKVARDIPERMEIVGLAAKSNAQKLAAQANLVRPEAVCLVDETKLEELRAALEYKPAIFAGEAGLSEIACLTNADMVLVAVVGTGGLATGAGGDRGGQRSGGGEQGDPGHGGRSGDARGARERRAGVCRSIANTTRSFSVWKGNVQSPNRRVDVER